MLSRFAKFLLVASSVAPMLLTWAFSDWRAHGPRAPQMIALTGVIGLTMLCWLVLCAAGRMLAHVSIRAKSVRSADAEVVGFMVAYLLPLVTTGTNQFDYAVLLFVVVLVSVVVWTSDAYSVNPLLSVLGYHFYEVESVDGVTFLLLSRGDIARCRDITEVQQLTHYVLLDAGDANG